MGKLFGKKPAAEERAKDIVRVETTLVPLGIEDGQSLFLVIGDGWNEEAYPIERFPDFPDGSRHALRGTLNGMNVAAQGISAFSEAQGVIRLAPQTLSTMRNASTMVVDGWNLGSLTQNGKIVESVRWVQGAGSAATVASMVGSMGMALALAAIQFQLSKMDKKLDAVVGLLEEAREDVHTQTFSVVRSNCRAIHNALDEIIANDGVIASETLHGVRHSRESLGTSIGILEHRIAVRERNLRACKGTKQQAEWFRNESSLLLLNCVSLYQAAIYKSLGDGIHSQFIGREGRDAEGHLLRARSAEAEELLRQVNDMLVSAYRAAMLIAADPRSGDRIVTKHSGQKVTLHQSALDFAIRLNEATGVAALSTPDLDGAEVLTRGSTSTSHRDSQLSDFQWLLAPHETLELACQGNERWLLATNERVLIVHPKRVSTPKTDIRWGDIRRVTTHLIEGPTQWITDNGGAHHIVMWYSDKDGHRFNLGDNDDAYHRKRRLGEYFDRSLPSRELTRSR